jgi:NDP-sugar pyrophosphorylase family protein
MKAILLAAGKGERLGEVTRARPKPMVELRGKPILQHNVELCVQHGASDLYINLHHLPELIRGHLGDGARFGAKIHYAFEPELLGTAGAVQAFAKGWREPFLVLYGDNLISYDLGALVAAHRARGAELTMAVHELEDVRQSGVAILGADDRITGFVEKPQSEPPSRWVNMGVYVLEPSLVAKIPAGFSDFGKQWIPQWVAEGRRVYAWRAPERVGAVDTPELLKKLTQRKS